jgi:TRAP-type C4-dicarboxylate transport system substrate-binding protein
MSAMMQALIRLTLCGVALAAMLPAAIAQKQTLALRLSHGFAPSHPLHAAIREWTASLTRESNATIAVQVHQQLGKTFDHYDMVRTGTADIAIAQPGLQIGRFPLFAAGELPLVFANAIGGTAAFDAWYRTHASQEMPDVKYCLAFVHDPGTLHVVRRKIETPIDIRGVKVRSTQNTLNAFVKLLGGSTVRAPESELRDLLVREVAQAVALPWQTAILSGTDQIARNHLDLPLYTTPFAMVLNKDKYAAMSEAQRRVMDRHCTNSWAGKIAAPWVYWELAGREAMRSLKGHDIYAITPEQIAAWRAATEPLIATWAARVSRAGREPDAALAALKAALAKHGAAF